MDILGIGLPELIFIVMIILIVLGPQDMVKVGRTLGRFLNQIVKSPFWQSFKQASSDLRTLPNKLMREAGLEELEEGIREAKTIRQQVDLRRSWQNPDGEDNKIAPWTTPPDSSAAADSGQAEPEAGNKPEAGPDPHDSDDPAPGAETNSGSQMPASRDPAGGDEPPTQPDQP